MATNIVITPKFRLSFASIIKPIINKFKPTDPPRYECTMLFPKDMDLSTLKSAAKQAAVEKFGLDGLRGIESPFRDGDTKDYDGYHGMISVKAWSKAKPQVLDGNKIAIESEEEIYSGCYCRASVTFFAYDYNGKKGVGCALVNVQKMADGEPFTKRSKAEDDFDVVAGTPAKSTVISSVPGKATVIDDWG